MQGRRITREEIEDIRKRKRRYRFLSVCGIVFVCLSACGAGYIGIHRLNGQEAEGCGREVTIGTVAELGTSELERESYDIILQRAEDEKANAMEYHVPDTDLLPVDAIEGDNWFDQTHFERASSEASPVELSHFNHSVFIGDSRTEALLLYSGLPNINGFCYKGLSVDKLDRDRVVTLPDESGKFTCYDAISKTFYDNYYLMFGMNELGWVYIEPFIDNFNALIDHILECNPDAIIYVESILPVSEKKSRESNIYTQERIEEFNAALKDMCMTRGDVIYLDLASAVTGEDGYLPPEASVDGVHCNVDYCKRLIEYIRCNTYIRLGS